MAMVNQSQCSFRSMNSLHCRKRLPTTSTIILRQSMTNYSNSYLQRFKGCPLSCRYHYELKLRPLEDMASSHHMIYSSAFHEGLRHLYLGDTLQSAQQAFAEGYPNQLDPLDEAKTQPNGIRALAMYASRWKEEDRKWEVLQCEQMDQQDSGFVVKLDLVMRHRETEQVFGWDHKTTGAYLNYAWWAQFEPNSQITEYVRFIRERYGWCDGFIVNAISFRYRQRAYKGEPAGFWCAFERQTFNRNQQQLDQELASRDYWIDRVEHAKASGLWGLNTQQCRFCEYKPICQAGWSWPEDEELIRIQYRQVCAKWFMHNDTLVPCDLDLHHEGEHAPITFAAPMAIAVEE